MDTLDSLLDAWDKDCEIDPTEPGKALINIPKLHSKYLRALISAKIKLKNAKDSFSIARKTKWNYYGGHYNSNKELLAELGLEPFKFILKQDIGIYMEADQQLVDISKKIAYYEEMSRALESILKELTQRTWQIKDLISWEKFVAGG